jgi:hypothetical protein
MGAAMAETETQQGLSISWENILLAYQTNALIACAPITFFLVYFLIK